MKTNWQPIEAPDIEKAKHLEEQRMFERNLTFLGIGLFIFAPFLAIISILIPQFYHRDRSDFENPYKKKLFKHKLYVLMYLFVFFFLFYFLIFPFIPTSVPIWGFWASLVLIHNFVINTVLFAVFTAVTLYLTYGYVKPWLYMKTTKYDDLVGKDNYLIIPTEDYGILNLKKINTGMMVIGATGSGKTQFIYQLMYQFPKKQDYMWVVFDPKGDYLKKFGDRKMDIIISLSPHEATHAWNIFREIATRYPLRGEEKLQEEIDKLAGIKQPQMPTITPPPEELSNPENIAKLNEKVDEAVSDRMKIIEEYEKKKKEEYEDFEADPQVEISEIMGELFKDLTESSQDKFWNYAAQQVLEGIVYMMYKKQLETYKELHNDWEESHDIWESIGKKGEEPKEPDFYDYLPNNSDLYEMVTTSTMEEVYAQLMNYPELKMVASYINPEAKKMAGSVWAVLGTQFRRIFQGTFGKEARYLKQISMKEYAYNPDGRIMFIEYDVEKGEVLGAIYRVLIDRLSEFAMSKDPRLKNKKKFFIIDEFQNVPKLSRYQNLVNFGRTLNVTSVIGIQTLTQVVEKYGEDVTNSIVSGHRFVFVFSVTDEKGKKFVDDRVGKRVFWTRRPVQMSGMKGGSMSVGAEYQRMEYTPINVGELGFWKSGKVLIIERNGWKIAKLFTFDEVIEDKKGRKRPIAKPIIDKVMREIKRREQELKAMEKKKKPVAQTIKKPQRVADPPKPKVAHAENKKKPTSPIAKNDTKTVVSKAKN